MKDEQIIEKLNQALLSAKASIDAVGKWTVLLAKEHNVELNSAKKKAEEMEVSLESMEDEQIVEGIFDGQNMIASDGSQYPVPANYASKSKLIEGDKLKLTIQPNGAFVFKQIELVPRKIITGKLVLDGSQYQVLNDDKTYAVLYASVTFFRGKVGDDVAIIIPTEEDAKWAAIENVIPAKVALENN